MQKPIALVILLALIACKGSGDRPAPTEGTPTPAPQVAAPPPKPAPAMAVAVRDLLKDYKDNEVAADGKYKDKRVAIVGTVADIKKDILDDPYVIVGTGRSFEFPEAQCYFANKEPRLATLKKGQLLALVCTCEGLMMNVQLKECVIVELDGGK